MPRAIGGRYVIDEVLGGGPTGTVWRGLGPAGPVAVKLLREELAAPDVPRRLERHVAALARLRHPRLVLPHEVVVDGSDVGLVMDLVEGVDLRRLLTDRGRLAPLDAVVVAAGLADALATGHGHGMVHHDVKPENVLLALGGGRPRARLGDYGVRTVLRTAQSALPPGTPAYLAPEVLEGLEVTGAVDVYALGTLLYETLTGRTPYGGSHPPEVLRRHVTDPLPDLSGLPEPLGKLLAGTLAKHPAARPSAAEMAAALWRFAGPVAAELPVSLASPEPHDDPPIPTAEPLMPARVSAPALTSAPTPAPTPAPASADAGGGDDLPSQASADRGSDRHRSLWWLAAVAAAVLVVSGVAFGLLRSDDAAVTATSGSGEGEEPVPDSVPPASASPTEATPTWQGWEVLDAPPGGAGGAPDSAAAGPDLTVVVQRSADGRLWTRDYDGTRFSDWRLLASERVSGDPTAASAGDGRVDVFARGADDAALLHWTRRADEWVGPASRGGGSYTSLDAVATPSGEIVLGARDPDGSLLLKVFDGTRWGRWVSQPADLSGGPALAVTEDGVVHVFATSADGGRLQQGSVTPADGTWSGWRDAGDLRAGSDLDAAGGSDGGVHLVAASEETGTVDHLSGDAYRGAWEREDLGRGTSFAPSVAAAGSERIDVFAVDEQGRLIHRAWR